MLKGLKMADVTKITELPGSSPQSVGQTARAYTAVHNGAKLFLKHASEKLGFEVDPPFRQYTANKYDQITMEL